MKRTTRQLGPFTSEGPGDQVIGKGLSIAPASTPLVLAFQQPADAGRLASSITRAPGGPST